MELWASNPLSESEKTQAILDLTEAMLSESEGWEEGEARQNISNLAELARFLSVVINEPREGLRVLASTLEILDQQGAEGLTDIKAKVLSTQASTLEGLGQYAEAFEVQSNLVSGLDKYLSSIDPQPLSPPLSTEVAKSARYCRLSGSIDEAKLLATRAVKLALALNPSDPQDLGLAYSELANCYQAKGEYNKALIEMSRTLDLYAESLGAEHPAYAGAMDSVGLIYQGLGQLDKAEEYHSSALVLREKLLPDSLEVATTLTNLAICLESQGFMEKGKEYKVRALEIRKAVLPENHPELGSGFNVLGESARASGDPEEARELFEKALLIWREALGPWHPHVAAVLNNLAQVNIAEGKNDQALLLLEQSLQVKKHSLGDWHPSVANSLNSLASLYSSGYKNVEKAVELRKEGLKILQKALGPEHPKVAVNMNNLAVLYSRIGEYAEASDLYQKALAIDEIVFGTHHPQVATDVNNLATLAFHCGEKQLSRQLYERALRIREEVLGPEHPKTLATAKNLGLVISQIQQDE